MSVSVPSPMNIPKRITDVKAKTQGYHFNGKIQTMRYGIGF
jgi:hypothetical protein